MKNYYEILGITGSASEKEIKQAYRTMAVIYHPDKNQGDSYAEEKFKEINEAYQILSDPRKKTQFDLILNYNTANQNRKQYSYNPNERTKTQYQRPNRPQYTRRTSEHIKPKLTFENSLRDLSEKNFFKMAFISIMVISSIIGLAEYTSYQKNEKIRLIAEQRALLLHKTRVSTASAIKNGEFIRAFELITQAEKTFSNEYVLTELNNYAIDSLTKRANFNFVNRDYNNALVDYNTLMEQRSYNAGITPLMYGRCLIKLNINQEAFGFLSNAVVNWDYNPQISYELAQIEYEIDSLKLANKHISLAENILKKKYIKSFGKFYYFNANNEHLPYFHYDIYMLHAKIKNSLGEPKVALRSYQWAEFLQPNLPQPLVSQGDIHLQLGHKSDACFLYNSALKLGYNSKLISTRCEN